MNIHLMCNICTNMHTYIYTYRCRYYMAVTRNGGLSRSPAPLSVTYLCRGPAVTNPCRGPLCRVLYSSIGLSRGGFVARPPDSVTSLVAKRPLGPVTIPMFVRRCHIYIYILYIYIYVFPHLYVCLYYLHLHCYSLSLYIQSMFSHL